MAYLIAAKSYFGHYKRVILTFGVSQDYNSYYNSYIDRACRFNTSFRREFCRKHSARLCIYCFGIIVGAVRTFRRRAACLKTESQTS